MNVEADGVQFFFNRGREFCYPNKKIKSSPFKTIILKKKISESDKEDKEDTILSSTSIRIDNKRNRDGNFKNELSDYTITKLQELKTQEFRDTKYELTKQNWFYVLPPSEKNIYTKKILIYKKIINIILCVKN